MSESRRRSRRAPVCVLGVLLIFVFVIIHPVDSRTGFQKPNDGKNNNQHNINEHKLYRSRNIFSSPIFPTTTSCRHPSSRWSTLIGRRKSEEDKRDSNINHGDSNNDDGVYIDTTLLNPNHHSSSIFSIARRKSTRNVKLTPRLYLFTKYPTPGRTKTRMIPALGEIGATNLHRRLVRKTIDTLDVFRQEHTEVDCRIRYDGAESIEEMRGWLGGDWIYESQGGGDLGERMNTATSMANGGEEGVGPVILIGSDCPFLTSKHLEQAVEILQEEDKEEGDSSSSVDVVIGPAQDGGYWLIGVKRPIPELFQNVDWGTDQVLTQTLHIAETLNLKVHLMETLSDMDRPADLDLWPVSPLTSVIVPVLNEEENLPRTLAAIYAKHPERGSVEVIVVDGGSQDRSKEIARRFGATVLTCSSANRAKQMNVGAAAASGDVLLFVHGDTMLPGDWEEQIRRTLSVVISTNNTTTNNAAALERESTSTTTTTITKQEESGSVGEISAPTPLVLATAFRLKIQSPHLIYRLLEAGVTARSSWPLHLPYGDQALAVTRETFQAIGGYPEVPIMEDFELVRQIQRLRKKGGGDGEMIALLPGAVITSARRWENLGVLRTTLINQCVLLGWQLGLPPETLADFYRQQTKKVQALTQEERYAQSILNKVIAEEEE